MEVDGGVGDLLDEVGAPVPLVARRVEPVERALHRAVRHRLHAVQERFGERVEQRRHRARRLLLRTAVVPHDAAHLAPVDRGREGVRGRHGGEGEEAVELARGGRQEVAVDRQHLGAQLDRPERRPCDHRVDLVQPELERGDDAEVAAAAADRPEEVGMLVGAGAHLLAVGEHHVGGEQVVDREAGRTRQVAQAAPERDSPDAGGGDDPARRGQPMGLGGPVELAQGGAAADPCGACLRVDLHAVHRREVDHQPVLAGAQPGAVVATAAHRQRQVALARERDRPGDVARTAAARDQRRPLVDRSVVDGPRLLVLGVLRPDQPAFEAGRPGARDLRRAAHALPLWLVSWATLERSRSRVMTRTDRLFGAPVAPQRPAMVRIDYGRGIIERGRRRPR